MKCVRPLAGIPACVLALTLALPAAAENIDPAGDDSQYAWGENVGWLNAEPSGDGGPGVEVGDFALSGWMWGENVGWVSLSCLNTTSCGTADFGVVNDGAGTLSGYAWSENTGWIDFAPSTAGVSIDPSTGFFSGRAWGENIGWVTFASTGTHPYKMATSWCQSVVAPPSGTPTLTASDGTQWTWSSLTGADWYEVVRGDLATLMAGGGDFSTATLECVEDNVVASGIVHSNDPPSGDAYWFLVRGVNCEGKATYDSGGTGQSGARDAEIAASGNDCE